MSNGKYVALAILALVCQVFLPGCRTTIKDWQTDIDVNMYNNIEMYAALNKEVYFEGEEIILKVVQVNQTTDTIHVPELFPFEHDDINRDLSEDTGKIIDGQVPFVDRWKRGVKSICPKDSLITIYQIHREYFTPDSSSVRILRSGKYTLKLEYPLRNYLGKVKTRQWKKCLSFEVIKPASSE
jgi:hypothetical protein